VTHAFSLHQFFIPLVVFDIFASQSVCIYQNIFDDSKEDYTFMIINGHLLIEYNIYVNEFKFYYSLHLLFIVAGLFICEWS
jgi:hypothetical protein